jgi:tetratricopeptide (TPR) repeat protein
MKIMLSSEERELWERVIVAFEEERSASLDILCQAFLEMRPDNVPAVALRLHALASLRLYDECVELMKHPPSLDHDEDARLWHREVGYFLLRSGQYSAAEAEFRRAAGYYPQVPGDLAVEIVNCVRLQGHGEQALREIDQSLGLDMELDDRAQLSYWRVLVLRSLRRFEDALGALDELERMDDVVVTHEKALREDLAGAIAQRRRL